MAAEGESARRALGRDANDIAAPKDYVAALESARGGDALISRARLLADAHAVETLIVDAVNSVLIVGLFDGVIAGFAYVVLHEIAGEATSVEVDAMYIDPPLRRVGVGEAMVDEVLRYARDKRGEVDRRRRASRRWSDEVVSRGNRLSRALARHAPIDGECVSEEPLTPVLCVGVVDVEDGALLLIKRRDPPCCRALDAAGRAS